MVAGQKKVKIGVAIAAGVVGLGLAPSVPAWAASSAVSASSNVVTPPTVNNNGTPPSVLGQAVTPTVLGETVPSSLPVTGTDVAGLVALGTVTVGGGLALLAGSARRRRAGAKP